MPLYDIVCPACGAQFEELAFGDETPACPQCGHAETQRQMSVPSPLKTGAFPFKPGPVHPLASKMGKGLAGCGQAGGCGSSSAPAAPSSGSACGGNGKFS